MKETLTWLALLSRPNVGCVKVRREVELAGDPAVCWNSWRQLRDTLCLSAHELNRQLFTLEFQGWIRRLPGRAYLRC